MDQSRALNALEPFLALAKSANSRRAAADLVSQAISAANTYVFAELLQQPNIQSLTHDEQYAKWYKLLEIFSYGTWKDYKAQSDLPTLSDLQTEKLRLLSFLTIASTKQSSPSASNLSYKSLIEELDLSTPLDLEQLVIKAIYSDLITATLNPASQIVVVTSVAPLRDVAPGSLTSMIAELAEWSSRCDSVLIELENEIAKIKDEAKKRNLRTTKSEKQFKAAIDHAEKFPSSNSSRIADYARQPRREGTGGQTDGDAMDVDSRESLGGAGKKRSAGSGEYARIFGRQGGKMGR